MAQIHPFGSFPPAIVAGVFDGDVLTELPFEVQKLKQVHGTEIVEVSAVGEDVEGDALLTNTPGVRLLIKTADCIPLVLWDPSSGWIAAVHAGWRGLTADLVPKTIARMIEKGARTADLQIGIGPSLGVECAAFSEPSKEIPAQYHWAVQPDQHVDLWAILERQLREAGVNMGKVEWMRTCTACDPRWFSWRRDKTLARLGTFIEIRVL